MMNAIQTIMSWNHSIRHKMTKYFIAASFRFHSSTCTLFSSNVHKYYQSTVRGRYSFSSLNGDDQETISNPVIQPTMRIGFIGLGNMGLPMSLNIEKKFPNCVIGYDTNQETCRIAQSEGLVVTDSMEHLIHTVTNETTTTTTETKSSNDSIQPCYSTIFTMVPNDTIIDRIMYEMMQHLPDYASSSTSSTTRQHFIFVDCSTVNPMTSRKWNEIWRNRGHWFYDAPVSGGVAGAQAGTLTFMVGTKPTTTDLTHTNDLHDAIGYPLIRPYLSSMGKQVIACGQPGAGAVAKLCNNLALASQMIGICEGT
jgi:3-hydroxyisobutyrate dehydrogenase-like beta-hydroxyacid dehydrogenase